MMTIGILSWKSPKTLINTLGSYRQYGLDKLDTEKVIFFQEISAEDIAIAKDYEYDFMGSRQNLGIAAAYKLMVEDAGGDLFLFLENDWRLLNDPTHEFTMATDLLQNGLLDVVRFRSTTDHGWPLWSRQWAGSELDHLPYLFDSMYWRDHPEYDFPDYIKTIGVGQTIRYTKARYANWTNNPTMFRTEWWLENIGPRIFEGDLEKAIQPWWEQQDFLVGQRHGLFIHERLDR